MAQHILHGIVVPVVTPMSQPGEVDLTALAPYLDALSGVGISKIMLFGSNGEGANLRSRDLSMVLESTVERWRRRPEARIFGAAIAPSTDLALERAEVIRDAGADAVVVSPPTFFRHRPDELIEHFAAFSDLGIPVIAYDNRGYSGNPLIAEVVEGLIELPHIVGIKDSSGDLENLRAAVSVSSSRADFAISQGDESRMLDGLLAGAVGVTPGTANISPSLSQWLWDCYLGGDIATAQEAQNLAAELASIHRVRPGIATTKWVLSRMGLIQPHASRPFAPLSENEKSGVSRIIVKLSEHLLRAPAI